MYFFRFHCVVFDSKYTYIENIYITLILSGAIRTMKKKVGSLVIVFLFSIFLLSGCFEDNNGSTDKKYFVGTWQGDIQQTNFSYIFYSNNSYVYKIGTMQSHGTWTLSNDQLNLTIAGSSTLFNYSFSNGYQSMTLEPMSLPFTYTLQKT